MVEQRDIDIINLELVFADLDTGNFLEIKLFL